MKAVKGFRQVIFSQIKKFLPSFTKYMDGDTEKSRVREEEV